MIQNFSKYIGRPNLGHGKSIPLTFILLLFIGSQSIRRKLTSSIVTKDTSAFRMSKQSKVISIRIKNRGG
jgi:hypothetical protein